MNEGTSNENDGKRPLTQEEQQSLAECVSAITAYGKASVEAATALRKIRDDRLYRETHRMFHRYCWEVFGFSRSKADRLIAMGRVVALLTPIGVIITRESQARPLIGLTDDQILEVGKRALEFAGEGPLTAAHFEEAALPLKNASNEPNRAKAKRQFVDVVRIREFITAAEIAINNGDTESLRRSLAELKACFPEGPPATDAVTDQVPPSVVPVPQPDVGRSGLVQAPKAAEPEATPLPAIRRRPVAIRIGDVELPANAWNEVPLTAANWLLDQGQCLPDLPFIVGSPSDYKRTAKQLRNGKWLGVGEDCRRLLGKTRRLLQSVSAVCSVKLADGQIIPLTGSCHQAAPPPVTPDQTEESNEGLECNECGANFDDDTDAVTLYECLDCGIQFSEETSANGRNQCPECNKFAAKVSDCGCPECNEGELQPVGRVS